MAFENNDILTQSMYSIIFCAAALLNENDDSYLAVGYITFGIAITLIVVGFIQCAVLTLSHHISSLCKYNI